ncbi:MAG: HAD family phosphatase [Azospira oryzae]|jgi:beta-phosphoglucomutase|nr:MAG: HAD family phosphatase [Azospira oryzae]
MSKPFALLFDMDGVIVDSNPAHKIALQKFARQHGYDLDEQQLREKIYGRTNKEWITNLFGVLPADTLQQYAHEKEAMYREIYKDDIQPVKGLVAFLDMLEANNIAKAIGTSAPRVNVDFSLSSTNLQNYFSIILDDTFVTHGKPDPEIYIKCAAAVGLPNAQCIVVEDSLSGVTAGKRAGSKVIGITTTHTKEELSEADLIINDFDELTLEKLQQLID